MFWCLFFGIICRIADYILFSSDPIRKLRRKTLCQENDELHDGEKVASAY